MRPTTIRPRSLGRIVSWVVLVGLALFSAWALLVIHGEREDLRVPASLVATPAPDASPEQVVQAYVDGINAKDADLVHSVTTADHAEFLDRTWLVGGGYMTRARVNGDSPTVYEDDDHAVVGLTFVIRDADPSMTEGMEYPWSVYLVREGGRWLVDEYGFAY